MKNRTFTAKQKAEIVLSVINKHENIVSVAKQYNITPRVIYLWKDDFTKKAVNVFETKRGESEKDKKIKKYEHVISKLTTQNDFLDKVLRHLG